VVQYQVLAQPGASADAKSRAAELFVIFKKTVSNMNKLIIFLGAITFLFTVPLLSVAGNQAMAELEGEMIAAELYCFSLEGLLFQIKEGFKSRDNVYNFFRQGFGPSLAGAYGDGH
jgi:hypothetical protein